MDETTAKPHETREWLRSKGIEALIDGAIEDGLTIAEMNRLLRRQRQLLRDLLQADGDCVFGEPAWGDREAALWARVKKELGGG